jgi:uncharacterized membrane protein SpoIIM required for sporulation
MTFNLTDRKRIMCLTGISFALWSVPFLTRVIIGNINVEQGDGNAASGSIMERITGLLSENNNFGAFKLIFFNNIKGCVINILGGFYLGLGTFFNIIYNGFFLF